jgi:hypothetical protein
MLLLAGLCAGAIDWRMLDAYPPHYVAKKLAPLESIAIDGKLDDLAWESAEWTSAMVDITRHENQQLNAVPSDVNARVKVRWDDDYLYIGAKLSEPFVTGKLFQHNHVPPYHDNDFEVFIDPSGTTQYYMEFEMNVLNSTYDIKWGKPDCGPDKCDQSGDSWPALPTCVNTSFSGYGGNWSMATRYHPGPMNLPNTAPALLNGSATDPSRGTTAWNHTGDTGMLTATSWDPAAFNNYRFPSSEWSLEIRFPIRQTPGYSTKAMGPEAHGGLLDADPIRQAEWNQYDPALGDPAPGRPRYWWVNFAKAEHTRVYTMKDGTKEVCPKNCTQALEHAVNSTPGGGPLVKKQWPTILGSYWEWVYGPVGDALPGVGYMHRPSSFPLIQFSNDSSPSHNSDKLLCRNIEFPGRHVAKSIYMAQLAYAGDHNGSFATSIKTLLNGTYCNLQEHTSDTCDIDALQFAVHHPTIFNIAILVTANISKITRACPTRPCYMASVTVMVPAATEHPPGRVGAGAGAGYTYVAHVNSNRDVVVDHPTVHGTSGEQFAAAPCL